MKRRRRQRGFTLVEMIVATILLAVGAVAAMICIGSATRAASVSRDYSTAAMMAEQRFAEIAQQPDQLQGGTQSGEFGADYPGFEWEQTVETTDFTGLVRVTLVIRWGGGSTPRSAQFVSYAETSPATSSTDTSATTSTGTSTN